MPAPATTASTTAAALRRWLASGEPQSPSGAFYAWVEEDGSPSFEYPEITGYALTHLAGLADPAPGLVPTRITPGVQRLLDRLGDTPVSVLDAAWNLLAWNAVWAALHGDPSSWRGRSRNLVWRAFADLPSRVLLTEAEHARWRASLVADLALVVARYPGDPDLAELVRELETSELERIRTEIGDDEWFEKEGRPHLSRELFETVALTGNEFIEFLTLPAYERLAD